MQVENIYRELQGAEDRTEFAIRALIVDDEAVARRGLRGLLDSEDDIEVVGECANGQEAISAIQSLQPDLVFLDVQMPGMTGFEVLRSVEPDKDPAVIFVTAFDRYALSAFDVDAVDYLLKPFTDERFREAVGRAKDQIRNTNILFRLNRHLYDLLDRVEARKDAGYRPRHLNRIPVKESGRVTFVQAENIDWIEAADNYVCLHVKGRSHLLRRTMTEMEKLLDPSQFLRIHRSRIVNIDRVREIHPQNSGDCVMVLHDGTRLNSSRTYGRRRRQMLNPMA